MPRWMMSVLTAAAIVTPVVAQEADEAAIKKIVQQEVERLLNSEGALDAAIERGIENFIRKQRAASEQARAEQQRVQARNLRPVDAQRDHILGNPDAPVTLVEYSDFECPFCKRFHPTVVRLMADNPEQLRWVYRHFPLEFHNPGAHQQAQASECVAELNGNDAFWMYADLIYERTTAGGNGFPLENLRPLAEEIGVNGDAFAACMADGRMAGRVDEDYKNGVEIGVSGTPAGFLINQAGEVRFIAGALPLEDLQGLVEELLR